MRRGMWLLLGFSLLLACEVNKAGTYTPDETVSEHNIDVMTDLFTHDADTGVVTFKTNDSQYYGIYGYTVWCLLEETQPEFVSREVTLARISGNISAGYGLVYCCYEDADYGSTMLVVMINNEREYVVAEVTGNVFEEITGWKESAFLKSGYNQGNTVRLEYDEASLDYTLYFNGEKETSFRDDEAPFHTGGQQGYIAVISPLDDFPDVPVEIQFEEK